MTQPNETKIPVKYVLYAHYANNESQDFTAWGDGNGKPIADLEGVKFLLSRFRSLRDLLTSPGYEGLVVLFYAPGITECFDGIAERREDLLRMHPSLRFAEAVSACVTDALREHKELQLRLRFVTALDLYDIFQGVNALDAEQLRWWFIGGTPEIHYDSPKIVEAIVRLRLLGNGVPVFRLDWDALFSGTDGALAELGLFKAIAICLKAYRLRLDDPTVATFLFSASYDVGRLRDEPARATFDDWRGAFATRIFPAISLIPDLISRAEKGEISWEKYAASAFNEVLARKFYGLAPDGLRADGINGLAKIGGHPLVSVISGALLCLSDGAIVDLPPFSNFSLNVSWIDDHLKYCLHRELRHLTSLDLRLSEASLSDAKLDDVMVAKARPQINNLPFYTLQKYLPTLLWGTIVDAWINPDPLLKCRPDDLSDEDRARWLQIARAGRSGAVLPQHLQVASETGRYNNADRMRLKKALIKTALERVTEVRRLWSELTDSGHETFASIWAKAEVNQYFPALTGAARGIAPDVPLRDPIVDETQLNIHLINDFEQLVSDALEYVHWTLNWPRIVRIVRSIEQGTLRTDMSWPLTDRGSASKLTAVAQ